MACGESSSNKYLEFAGCRGNGLVREACVLYEQQRIGEFNVPWLLTWQPWPHWSLEGHAI